MIKGRLKNIVGFQTAFLLGNENCYGIIKRVFIEWKPYFKKGLS